jgi:hypothetical protein
MSKALRRGKPYLAASARVGEAARSAARGHRVAARRVETVGRVVRARRARSRSWRGASVARAVARGGGRAGSRRAGGAATLVGDSVGDRLKYPPLDAARALVDDLQCRFFLGGVPGIGRDGGEGEDASFEQTHGAKGRSRLLVVEQDSSRASTAGRRR